MQIRIPWYDSFVRKSIREKINYYKSDIEDFWRNICMKDSSNSANRNRSCVAIKTCGGPIRSRSPPGKGELNI